MVTAVFSDVIMPADKGEVTVLAVPPPRPRVASVPLERITKEDLTLEQFSLASRSCPDQEDQALLEKFCLLYGTKLVFQERTWYLEHKYLTPLASKRIRCQLLDLCDSVKDDALRVISAFNILHISLHAPIAGIVNPMAPWAFYPAPQHPLARETARSPRPKLGAKLKPVWRKGWWPARSCQNASQTPGAGARGRVARAGPRPSGIWVVESGSR
ncbi:acyl-coenzyme A oxidase-like protein [Hippopotamus amphibius kiboko]|uniref:acyl-coenzyme A oxidase-like protein n=1 Tax=Hippopotamus amphibius kiboko TaxID=575201 RepID=UPI002595E629|nr:acyl-coenzyme A oxidase-like protein [Hippopotamus amphibius kiboko]